jgi:hypothetical protein
MNMSSAALLHLPVRVATICQRPFRPRRIVSNLASSTPSKASVAPASRCDASASAAAHSIANAASRLRLFSAEVGRFRPPFPPPPHFPSAAAPPETRPAAAP